MGKTDLLILGVFLVAFVVLEFFTVRSARKTTSLDDPMMQSSLIGRAAQNSMVVRIIAGTIGALGGAAIASVIALLIAEKALGWE